MKVGFIGTGNMGGALAHAAAQSPAPAELLLSNRTPEKAQALAQQLGATVSDNETIARTCDYIFLGVKPQMMADLLSRLQPILSRRQEGFVLVSMAAGLTLQRLGEMAGLSCPILRIMPNTACAVGAGLTLYVPSPEVTEEQLSAFLTLMSASGRLEPLEEHLIDAGSAVAGCGGAFVSLFLEALADGAVTCGLPRDKARRPDGAGYGAAGSPVRPAHRRHEGCRLLPRRHHHRRGPGAGAGRLPLGGHGGRHCCL